MPLERAVRGDAAATDGMVRSHRFFGGHTALAALNNDNDTLARQQQFLQNAVRIDVLRSPDITGTGARVLERVPVQPGEHLKLDVVLVNERVGHNFPAGTADVADVWVEVVLRDADGRVLMQSGLLGADQAPDPDAHFLLTRPIDDHGVPAVMRDPHRYRAQAYDTTIPPRAARVIRYEGDVSSAARAPLQLTARVLHRRISDPYWSHICAQLQQAEHRRCPPRPITEVAQYSSTAIYSARTEWQRYYDHGRALTEYQVQERVAEATGSLEIARQLQPDSAGPWVELGRLALRQSRVEDAYALLAQASQRDPRSLVPDYLRALASADVWHFSDTIAPLLRVRAALPQHPRTIELLANALGLEGRHNEALSLLFQGLNIDPERPQMLNLMAIELNALQAPEESVRAREAYERHRFHDGIPRLRSLCKRDIPRCQRESEPVHTHPLTAPPLHR
jgi:tetratricopeptide (TPR) repeat protein